MHLRVVDVRIVPGQGLASAGLSAAQGPVVLVFLRLTTLTALLLSVLAVAQAHGAPPTFTPAQLDSAGTTRVYYELRHPAGTPRGVVLVLHSGGWTSVGITRVRELGEYRDLMKKLRDRDLITVNTTYQAGEAGWKDVLAHYQQIKQRFPGLPVSALGRSAGGHWSLLLGTVKPLAGVVSDAGTTNFPSWRDTYACYYKNCQDLAPGYKSLGAFWYGQVSDLFGAANAPSPNINDYDPSAGYSSTDGADPYLIYGRRQDELGGQLADSTPNDGTGGAGAGIPDPHPYVDADNDPGPTGVLETDTTVTQQQGTYLKDVVGSRGTLVTLRKGPSTWVHGDVNETDLENAYTGAADFLADRSDTAGTTTTSRPEGLQRPAGQAGTYKVRSCQAAPGRGLLSTGAWTHTLSPGAAPGVDLSENCATTVSADPAGVPTEQSAATGMSLRTSPRAGTVPAGSGATAQFVSPPGTTVAQYTTSYHGRRSGPFVFALASETTGGATEFVKLCMHTVDCGNGTTTDLAPPGTANPATGPFPQETINLPANIRKLTWGLQCAQSGGCSVAPTGDSTHQNLQAYLNVFSSEVTVTDPEIPDGTLAGALFTETPQNAANLSGTINATDNTGIRQITLTVNGTTQTINRNCDYTLPRPCENTGDVAVTFNASGLATGTYPVEVVLTDAANNTRTLTRTLDLIQTGTPPQITNIRFHSDTELRADVADTDGTVNACTIALRAAGSNDAYTPASDPAVTAGTCRATVPDGTSAGTYEIQVTATDDDDITVTATVTRAYAPNTPPTVATPDVTDRAVTAAVTDDGTVTTCQITFKALPDGAATTNPGTISAGVCTGTVPAGVDGLYRVTVTVTDDDDASAEASVTVRFYVIVTPPPPTTTTPPAVEPPPPTTIVRTGFAALTAPALQLACTPRRLVLTTTTVRGRRVTLTGVAEDDLAGRTVTITTGGRRVAKTKIAKNGTFTTSAPRPAKHRTTTTRYQARVGTERSATIPLTRTITLTSARATTSNVTLRGRVNMPAGPKRRLTVTIRQITGCETTRKVSRTVAVTRTGAFTITVPAPKNTTAALYRADLTAPKTKTRKAITARSLPMAVTLPDTPAGQTRR